MASIADKIKHNSIHRVNLYKEGLFWVAYEQSAAQTQVITKDY